MMKIELIVKVNGQFYNYGAGRVIDELQRECFEPLKTCTDVQLAGMLGEVSVEQSKLVMKTREDAAKILADELADMIVRSMKQNDTHNGYKVDG